MENKIVKRNKIESLQALRTLAFLGVFLNHCGVLEVGGAWGVSIFIILSGFLMIYTYYEKNLDTDFRSCVFFSINKIKKLYPLHILTTFVAFFLSNILFDIPIDFRYVLKFILNLLLIQAWIPNYDVLLHFNGVTWYLSLCMFLYAVFPLVLKFIKK